MRVLDLDLDFFLRDKAHFMDGSEGRLDPDEYPPWPLDLAMTFLTERCRLDEARPGFVVEQHNELFYVWGSAIEAGQLVAPFEVVHVDAHADLGLGDASYAYLMRELAFEPIEQRYAILKRRRPGSRKEMLDLSIDALTDGNWLMFALACGWISDLTFVCNSFAETTNEHTPNDLMGLLLKDFDRDSGYLQVVATREDFVMSGRATPRVIDRRDSPIPFTVKTWREFHASEPFDIVCLTRSPQYTPAAADPIFDAIRERFINENAPP
jgi:hypothetical protein